MVDHLFQDFKGKVLKEVTPTAIEAYKGKRLNQSAAPATVNREMACGKAIFNWAIKSDKATENPFRKVKFLHEDNEILRYLTTDDVQSLLNACPFHLRLVVATALNTGMR